MTENELKIGRIERYIITNQLRILEALYPEEANEISVHREIFERGYEMLYSIGLEHIYDADDIMTQREASEVWSTFSMFKDLGRAYQVHPDLNIESYLVSKFCGYDGNAESKFMYFAVFTVEKMKRFQFLPMKTPGYWDSHAPMRDIYRRMVEAWHRIPQEQRYNLNEDQVINILDAGRNHPTEENLDG